MGVRRSLGRLRIDELSGSARCKRHGLLTAAADHPAISAHGSLLASGFRRDLASGDNFSRRFE
jgi:hypothetical protein